MELWERLNPPDRIASLQRAYDRHALIWRLHKGGMQQKEIARRMGVTRTRIWQIFHSFDRKRAEPSPIERWLEASLEPDSLVWELYSMTGHEYSLLHRGFIRINGRLRRA